MMNGMPAGEPKAPQAPEEGDEGSAPNVGPKQLVTGIHTQMMALMDMMSKSPGIADEDKQELAAIISQYQNFVKTKLGSSGPQKPPQAPPSNVSPEAAGNPNARPM
jgi:hypothetical protein